MPCSLNSKLLLALHTTASPDLTLCFSSLPPLLLSFSASTMHGSDARLNLLTEPRQTDPSIFSFGLGGLFIEADAVPASFVSLVSSKPFSERNRISYVSLGGQHRALRLEILKRVEGISTNVGHGFLSLSLSVKRSEDYVQESGEALVPYENQDSDEKVEALSSTSNEKENARVAGSGAFNTTKHLWAGSVAAMVSRTCVAPLERLKLEYIVRGEQKNIIEVVKEIAMSQGLKGFWKGNFVNILRTAPFKAVNFYAYDTYRNRLLKMTGNEETTNFERFVAGAAAGITATLLCLPMDTIRTVMVAPGGEALGGVVGVFRHMVKTEGFFSLYKGLIPSIISMAPSGAVFYGVYDILKSGYLHSPEGRKRLQRMKEESQELSAFEQLELGPTRTLLYGAIAGACSEAATYPFEVVRRQLQMQMRATRLNPMATCVKIVEQGGIPALYAGLIPSLLQVLPSAAISYFVYEFMKIVLHVESS